MGPESHRDHAGSFLDPHIIRINFRIYFNYSIKVILIYQFAFSSIPGRASVIGAPRPRTLRWHHRRPVLGRPKPRTRPTQAKPGLDTTGLSVFILRALVGDFGLDLLHKNGCSTSAGAASMEVDCKIESTALDAAIGLQPGPTRWLLSDKKLEFTMLPYDIESY